MSGGLAKILKTALVTGAIAIGGWLIYSWIIIPKTPERDSDGLIVSRVVSAKLNSAHDIRVGILTGQVQGVSFDTRWGGILRSSRVMKAPFQVDYFVDLASLDSADFRWDDKTHTLVVDAPDVRVGAVNVDESHVTLDKTGGVWVTRDAMAELHRKGSIRAHAVADHEAKSPTNLDRARRFARKAVKVQFEQPLRAVGMNVDVRVRFPSDRGDSDVQWDRSRSLAEIFAIGR